MDRMISSKWLKTAIHNFYKGLNHTPTEEDIQAYIDAAPCEDCIRRSDIGLTDLEILMCNGDYKEALKMLLDKIEKAQPVTLHESHMKKLDDIRAYLVENVFRNPVAMFSDDRDLIDLPEIIASLYECLHIVITGEPYEYMFHWANKVGSDVDDQLFMEDN